MGSLDGYSHGTRSAYTRGGCRCTACRRANADYQKTQREIAKQRLKAQGAVEALEELAQDLGALAENMWPLGSVEDRETWSTYRAAAWVALEKSKTYDKGPGK